MSIFTSRPMLRWVVPATAALAVIGASVAARTLAAQAEPTLPPRSPAQLLVDLQTARLDGLSGTVVERADLGLPALPSLGALGGPSGTELTSLLSGKHTLRVWYSGPEKARVALLGTNGESDIIRNGTDVWTWDSRTNTATHRTLSTESAKKADRLPGTTPKDLPGGVVSNLPKTPQEAADMALRALDPSTVVKAGKSARVAGRDAYELILSPKDTDSLVGEVRLAIDAKEHLPLRFQVFAKGATQAAFEVAFSQVSFSRPEAAQFTFAPPPGAVVKTETDAPDSKGSIPSDKATEGKPTLPISPDKTTVVGTGWTSVFVARMAQQAPGTATTPEGRSAADAANTFLQGLPTVSGGKVISTKLFSVLLTDDGRVLVGAVTPDRLSKVAADPAAALK
jgi:outer membrane lipoprotein-sorting protein